MSDFQLSMQLSVKSTSEASFAMQTGEPIAVPNNVVIISFSVLLGCNVINVLYNYRYFASFTLRLWSSEDC